MLVRHSFVLVVLLMLISCGSEPPPTKSADIQTEIIAKANGNGETIIEASLQVKNENQEVKDIEVELPFSIQAKVGNQVRTLFKTKRDGETIYSTKLPTDSIDKKYVVTAVAEDKESANNFIELPQPFRITSIPDKNYERNQDINITWDNIKQDGTIEAGFALTCVGQNKPAIVILRKEVNDSGFLNINASELVSNADLKVDTSQGCEAVVILSRKTEKALNPLFGKGSYSLGVQERRTNFSIKGDSKTTKL